MLRFSGYERNVALPPGRQTHSVTTRRRFIGTLALGFLTAPLAAEAQQAAKVYRVGLLFGVSPVSVMAGPEPVNPAARAFVQGMRALGYVEGRNLILERRSVEGRGLERVADIVAELVRLKVDVIVTVANPMIREAKRVTTVVPIVMVGVSAPVEDGLVASLAHPDGNVTGLTSDTGPEIEGKRLELLREALPGVSRVAYIAFKGYWENEWGKSAQTAARALGLTLLLAEQQLNDYTGAFAFIDRERPDAIIVTLAPTATPTDASLPNSQRRRGCRGCTHTESSSRPGASCSMGTTFETSSAAPLSTWTRS